MFTLEFSVLLGLSALLGGVSLVQSVRAALPQVAAIRQALAECPEQREVRFTIREVVVRYNDGKVVPLRQRQPIKLTLRPGRPGARAAA